MAVRPPRASAAPRRAAPALKLTSAAPAICAQLHYDAEKASPVGASLGGSERGLEGRLVLPGCSLRPGGAAEPNGLLPERLLLGSESLKAEVVRFQESGESSSVEEANSDRPDGAEAAGSAGPLAGGGVLLRELRLQVSSGGADGEEDLTSVLTTRGDKSHLSGSSDELSQHGPRRTRLRSTVL